MLWQWLMAERGWDEDIYPWEKPSTLFGSPRETRRASMSIEGQPSIRCQRSQRVKGAPIHGAPLNSRLKPKLDEKCPARRARVRIRMFPTVGQLAWGNKAQKG